MTGPAVSKVADFAETDARCECRHLESACEKIADQVKLSSESIGNVSISNKNNMLLATDGNKYATMAKNAIDSFVSVGQTR